MQAIDILVYREKQIKEERKKHLVGYNDASLADYIQGREGNNISIKIKLTRPYIFMHI